jgi:hypothetical protein
MSRKQEPQGAVESDKRIAVGARVLPKTAARIKELAESDYRTVSFIASLVLDEWAANGGKLPKMPGKR